ncbi:MAG: 5-(carboxyamino)imidazole ribonucleotide synthase [Saprospiraceae bacterium]|nr:5-(carboxyamino)imidazole ribonucleotide synthase [Saprospiraceae bacterium]
MLRSKRIGVLGGGQLGKMMAQAAGRWNLDLHLMDKTTDFPAAQVTDGFIVGDFSKYDPVYSFGQEMDVITIEIENVNTDALAQLEADGKAVYPQPRVIRTIKDKGLQKLFYRNHQLPTSDFALYEGASDIQKAIDAGTLKLPFVQKARTGGYDGRGVHVIRTKEDLDQLLPTTSVVEDMIDIEKELSVIVARNPSDAVCCFPVVEMTFHPTANLVEDLRSPAAISDDLVLQIEQLAHRVIRAYNMVGILAIELFFTKDGALLINEVAPRAHNSGHQTIEANICSQYEQLLRAILDLPLGSTQQRAPAVMVNILGEPGHHGPARYEGLEKCLAMPDVHLHIYGKKETKPYRKMGHATILGATLEEAVEKAKEVSGLIKVISS